MISGVIPAYNEETDLEIAVNALSEIFAQYSPMNWEIVIVDDGSQDNTPMIAAKLSKSPGISLIRHPRNEGKGAAVKSGVLHTKGDFVLIFDADMSTPPQMLGAFIHELENGADIITGDRRSPKSRIIMPQPPLRRFMGKIYAAIARRVSGVPLSDFNCGFKLFKGDIARALLSQCGSKRWAWDVEVIATAAQQNLSIRALPVTWSQGERSSVRPMRAAVGSLVELISLAIRLRSMAG